jgi:phosphohistidine swiveling domain-containing protein
MNQKAIQDAYNLFTESGYKKSIDDFKSLIKTNPNALNDSYELFKGKGYNKDIESYKSLVGVSEKKSSVSTGTTPQEVSSTPLQGQSTTLGGEDKEKPKPLVTSGGAKPKATTPKITSKEKAEFDEAFKSKTTTPPMGVIGTDFANDPYKGQRDKSGNIIPGRQIDKSILKLVEDKKSAISGVESDVAIKQSEGILPPNSLLIETGDKILPIYDEQPEFLKVKSFDETLQEQINPLKTSVKKPKVNYENLKKSRDLELQNPYLYFSKSKEGDTDVDNFYTNKINNLPINKDDFDGFLRKNGYLSDVKKDVESGLYDKDRGVFSENYNEELIKEKRLVDYLSLYIDDKNQRDYDLRVINYKQENPNATEKDIEKNVSKYTFVSDNDLEKYIEETFPIYTKNLKERKNKEKEEWEETKENKGNFFSWQTVKKIGAGFQETIGNRVSQLTSTIYETIGMEDISKQIRFSAEEDAFNRPENRDISYVSGKKVSYNGSDYLIDSEGQVYDYDLKKRVTDLFTKNEYDSIVESSKKGEDDNLFSWVGATVQTTNVIADLGLQIALTRGFSGASGLAVRGLSKEGLDVLSKMPVSNAMASSAAAQTFLGYSQGLEDTLVAAKNAGIPDSEAKAIANDAAIKTAALYLFTSGISPQTKASFMAGKDKLIKEAIDVYAKKGKSSYIKFLNNGINNLTTFLKEGGKETGQEVVQTAGTVYGINPSINEAAGKDIVQREMTADQVISMIPSTFVAGFSPIMLRNVGGIFTRKDYLSNLDVASNNVDLSNKRLDELLSQEVITKGEYSQSKEDLRVYSQNKSKIPKDTSSDIVLDVAKKLDEISKLESEKKNLDQAFHEKIDQDINNKRTEIKDLYEKQRKETTAKEPVEERPTGEQKVEATTTAEGQQDKVLQEAKDNVEELRQQELVEFREQVENAEDFITDGKVDANKVDESDNAKAKEIYAKYDAQIKPLLDNIKTQEDAIQKQSTDEGVLRPEQPEVGLQEVVEGDQKPEDVTEEGKKEIVPGSKTVVSGIEITYPTAEQETERKEARSKTEYVEEASKDLDVEDTTVMSKELEGDFGLLTAENPMAKPLTEAENVALNKKAKQWLESRGYKPRRLTGKYAQAENSFFVPNLSKADAIAFAKEFNQDSVAHSEGLIYQDGSMNPRVESDDDFTFSKSYDANSDNVSVVRTKDGLKTFSVGYNFNERVQPKKAESKGREVSKNTDQAKTQLSNVADKRIAKAVFNGVKAIAKILPNVKVIIHDTDESFRSVSGEGKNQESSGLYQNGEIHINLPKANARTVAHEIFHAILLDKVKTDANAQAVTKKMIQALASKIEGNPALKAKLEDFASMYDENIQNEEKLAELVGIMAENYNSLSERAKEIIKNWLNNLAKAFGVELFESNEVFDVLNTIAKKVATGSKVTVEDVSILDNGTNPIGNPTEIRMPKKRESKIDFKDSYENSLVTPDKKVDIYSLLEDIVDKKQKVWFWVADQLGINKELGIDGGPSFAHQKEGDIWASGVSAKDIQKKINESEYIFIISGSPQLSKLFNKKVFDLMTSKFGDYKTFKEAILSLKPTKDIKEVLEAHSSWDSLKKDASVDSTITNKKAQEDLVKSGIENPTEQQIKEYKTQKTKIGIGRKKFLNSLVNIQQKPNTAVYKYISSINGHTDVNDLRDGFYKDNGFELNDIMLVLKPTGVRSGSEHSTYENTVEGEVIGVPDAKINALEVMPKEMADKYAGRPSQASQAIAPYGSGVKEIFAISSKRQQKILPEKVSEKLTEDGDGNFVFKHYSDERRSVIKKGQGQNRITSTEESSALSSVGGLAMFYTMANQAEAGVGNVEHTVLIPKDKVYDIDSDPLNFEAEARKRFNEVRPGQAFTNNYRGAFITKIANENGFDIAISQWRGAELRAQTTIELKPETTNTEFKERPLDTFKDGDYAIIDGRESIITNVDGDRLRYESIDGVAKGTTVNNEKNRRRIIKIDNPSVRMQKPKKLSAQIEKNKELKSEISDLKKQFNDVISAIKTERDITKKEALQKQADRLNKKISDLREKSKAEISALKEQMDDLFSSAKEAIKIQTDKAKTIKGIKKQISDFIKDNLSNVDPKDINKTQQKSLLNALVSVNDENFEEVLGDVLNVFDAIDSKKENATKKAYDSIINKIIKPSFYTSGKEGKVTKTKITDRYKVKIKEAVDKFSKIKNPTIKQKEEFINEMSQLKASGIQDRKSIDDSIKDDRERKASRAAIDLLKKNKSVLPETKIDTTNDLEVDDAFALGGVILDGIVYPNTKVGISKFKEAAGKGMVRITPYKAFKAVRTGKQLSIKQRVKRFFRTSALKNFGLASFYVSLKSDKESDDFIEKNFDGPIRQLSTNRLKVSAMFTANRNKFLLGVGVNLKKSKSQLVQYFRGKWDIDIKNRFSGRKVGGLFSFTNHHNMFELNGEKVGYADVISDFNSRISNETNQLLAEKIIIEKEKFEAKYKAFEGLRDQHIVDLFNMIRQPDGLAKFLNNYSEDVALMVANYINSNPELRKMADKAIDLYKPVALQMNPVLDKLGYDTFNDKKYSKKQDEIAVINNSNLSQEEKSNRIEKIEKEFRILNAIYPEGLPELVPYYPISAETEVSTSDEAKFFEDGATNDYSLVFPNLITRKSGGSLVFGKMGLLDRYERITEDAVSFIAGHEIMGLSQELFTGTNGSILKDNLGENFVSQAKSEVLNVVKNKSTGESVFDVVKTYPLLKYVYRVSGLQTAGELLINFKSASFQIAGVLVTYAKTPSALKLIPNLLTTKNGRETLRKAYDILNTSIELQDRINHKKDNAEVKILESIDKNNNTNLSFATALVSDSMVLTTLSDYLSIVLATPIYIKKANEYMKDNAGVSESEALLTVLPSFFADEVNTTLQSNDSYYMGSNFKSGIALLLGLGKFVQAPRQIALLSVKEIADAYNRRKSVADASGKVLVYSIGGIVMFKLLADRMFGDDDDEEKLSEADKETKMLKETNEAINSLLVASGLYGEVLVSVKDAYLTNERPEILGFTKPKADLAGLDYFNIVTKNSLKNISIPLRNLDAVLDNREVYSTTDQALAALQFGTGTPLFKLKKQSDYFTALAKQELTFREYWMFLSNQYKITDFKKIEKEMERHSKILELSYRRYSDPKNKILNDNFLNDEERKAMSGMSNEEKVFFLENVRMNKIAEDFTLKYQEQMNMLKENKNVSKYYDVRKARFEENMTEEVYRLIENKVKYLSGGLSEKDALLINKEVRDNVLKSKDEFKQKEDLSEAEIESVLESIAKKVDKRVESDYLDTSAKMLQEFTSGKKKARAIYNLYKFAKEKNVENRYLEIISEELDDKTLGELDRIIKEEGL